MFTAIKTLFWFAYFWIFLILSIPFLFVADIIKALGKDESYKKLVIAVTRLWTNSLLLIAGVKVKTKNIHNVPKDKAVLYILNHQGNFDIPISISYLPGYIALVSKKEIGKLPLVSSWMKRLRCVLIDRDDPRQSLKMLYKAGESIAEGYSVVVFPEGTRSDSTEVGEFKAGAFRLAQKANCTIVPVAIEGTYNIMQKRSVLIHCADVTLNFCKPIDVATLTKEQKSNLHETVREVIIKAKQESVL